jgi:sterol desaturase/sphingolipid hydroxylase (fatty acid hydroxylase superfamily)
MALVTILYSGNEELSPWVVFVLLPMLVYLGVYWGLSALYALADRYLEARSLLAFYKFQPQLVVRNGGRIDWKKYAQSAKRALKNQLFIALPMMIFMSPLWQWRGLGLYRPWPSIGVILLQIAVAVLIIDGHFYLVHRALHTPKLYALIHKTHHAWRSPVACSAHDAHPLEYLFANLMPFAISSMVVGLHWVLVLVAFAFATFRLVAAHSGWRPRFLGSASHELHHQFLVVNFGIVGFWDRVFGTWKIMKNGKPERT